MKLKSLQIGHIKDYKGFRSAFIKDLYLEEVDINSLGILNDNIADTKHHGGKIKPYLQILIITTPFGKIFLEKNLHAV